MKVGKIFRDSMINRISNAMNKNSNVFVMNYTKLSGPQINTIRKDLKKIGAQMYVSRNSIIDLAFKKLEQEDLSGKVDGQTALIWTNTDSVEISKLLMKFAKEFQGISVRGGLLEGVVLKQEDVKKLSDLPSRTVLLSTLLGTMIAPATRLLGAMNGKSRDLLSILKQLSEKKGGN